MKTIVINSQKGGSGKTMLCAHLSVTAEREGDGPVYLIDTDPQGTLSTWHEIRQAEVPHRANVRLDRFAEGLQRVKDLGAAYCFIDTAPSRSADTAALFKLADLVIVPIRPSPSDLWAASATVQQLKADRVPFLFVLNMVKANTSITAQAAAALSQHGPVAQTFIGDRVPYAAAMTDGRTALELAPKSPSAQECAALWQFIKSSLHEIMKSGKEAGSHA